MAGKGSYVPPQYIPLYGLDTEEDRVSAEENDAARHKLTRDPTQWSSGICACFDDPQSCMLLSDLWLLDFRRKDKRCYLVAC